MGQNPAAMQNSVKDEVDEILAQWRQERPDLDPTGMGVVLRVLQLSGIFSSRLDEVLAPSDLAPFEFEVLSALRRADEGEGLTATELCAAAQVTSGTMTHRLDRLEERELIHREPAEHDARALAVTLTTKGQRLVDGVLADRMEDARICVEKLTQKDRRTLNRLLRTILVSVTEDH